MDAYLRRDMLDSHVERICKNYKVQMETMLDKLSQCSGIARYTRPEGGLFIWAELEEGKNALELLKKAVEKKVAYVPGTHFFADGGHENTLRLNFSMSPVKDILTGMEKLKEIFAE